MSAPLSSLCCFLIDGLLDFCARDEDLEALGAFGVPSDESLLGPRAWARIVTLRWIREQPRLERILTDRLDLRFAETVLEVRSLELPDLRVRVADAAERLDPQHLPAWLWALGTDPRRESQRQASALVVRLQRELHHRWLDASTADA